MTLVEMAQLRVDAHRAQRPHAAYAKDHLL